MPDKELSPDSAIRDNYLGKNVGDFLENKIENGSALSFVSAYFTIYAYHALKDSLNDIDELRFLFGEPRFVKSVDPENKNTKEYKIEDEGLTYDDRLKQNWIAKECADWISQDNVKIQSIKQSNLMHGKMYHISNNGVNDAIVGSSNFTVRGLGLSHSINNIELNLEVDSNRDRNDLKTWFDKIWDDKTLVENVKDEVVDYIKKLYQNNAPEFIYFKTLFHIFQYLRQK